MSPRSLLDVSLALRDKIDTFLAHDAESPLLRRVQAQLRISIAVVDEALSKFQPEEIALSYNGGKDCLVLLVVILARFSVRPAESPTNTTADNTVTTSNGTTKPSKVPQQLQSVYIVPPHPFPEVDAFVASSGAEYHLDVDRYSLPMKEGLEAYLADRPSVKAIFVGTRRTDPHGEKLTHFDPTDAGWPAFMRIHPGYTSLGGTRDTHPNPQLKIKGENGREFRPAYELTEDDEERLGRDR
ncbi:hypothetical protein PISL3812_03538 [Talaromyces islandicus]|uniref:FAD synthase n=1 Tax=Talaromyces islandicus TaxID=28573 RepID=A0A0U1LV49_TALIS|nr:hypothetical protein PISL3812_03538 [Talaromyces islandicus]